MQDWLTQSAADQGRAIGAGKLDPVALTEAYLDAIRAHEYGDRIYARLTPERAKAEAEAAAFRAKNGVRRGILDGVPISWKDLFDSAGVATEAGSALLAGRVPEADALVLAEATLQGAVCLGKTHMTELAFSGLGLNPVTASPPNVNDPACVSGGSSSGAAASVAWGLAAAGIGSDTGGSVRVPSCWNDLVGLKTTSGLIPLKGVVPLAAKFDTIGPLARTVEDAAILFAMLTGGKAPDLRGATSSGRRFAVLRTVALDGLQDAPAQGFQTALRKLEAAGAILIEIDAPEVAEMMALAGVIYTPETYGTWGELIESAPDKMYPPVLERFRSGRDHAGHDYVAAWHKLDALRIRYAERVAGYDAVLVPTVASLPPRIDAVSADAALFTAENLLALRNTRIGNLTGGAALTLPTGVPGTGISLMGPALSEQRLLHLGGAAEAALRA
ncbi:amidase [Donghicola sp. C2-DW-16]|uniref:Amidase n=1 Tax=Donghicola mangrovi TaxID=2729614 RepID=A0ABX2PAZ9_9RHOB|nr:amidase family protein [Donghicola mangrovi]NVO25864.1 amidase [Donghicola mangrovi]